MSAARFPACSGVVEVARGRVCWVMTRDEARELADFMEESVTPADMAMEDVAALRRAADYIEGESK